MASLIWGTGNFQLVEYRESSWTDHCCHLNEPFRKEEYTVEEGEVIVVWPQVSVFHTFLNNEYHFQVHLYDEAPKKMNRIKPEWYESFNAECSDTNWCEFKDFSTK